MLRTAGRKENLTEIFLVCLMSNIYLVYNVVKSSADRYKVLKIWDYSETRIC